MGEALEGTMYPTSAWVWWLLIERRDRGARICRGAGVVAVAEEGAEADAVCGSPTEEAEEDGEDAAEAGGEDAEAMLASVVLTCGPRNALKPSLRF